MTTTLVIDTSTSRTTVGIVVDGKLEFVAQQDDPLAHAEVLPKFA